MGQLRGLGGGHRLRCGIGHARGSKVLLQDLGGSLAGEHSVYDEAVSISVCECLNILGFRWDMRPCYIVQPTSIDISNN